MLEKEINSTYLKENMNLKIYLPENYSSFNKYEVCIMQDGNDYYQLGRIATLSDDLHSKNKIKCTIFVGIHYKDKFDRSTKYHPDGKQQNDYSSFLARELVPLLDETFSTEMTGSCRTLMGDSLAGSLALTTAIKFPHTFGKVIMQSPYIDDDLLNHVKNAQDMFLTDIYHTIGAKETAVNTTSGEVIDFIIPNRELSTFLSTKEINYQYKENPNGEHTWKYWQKELPEILSSMFK